MAKSKKSPKSRAAAKPAAAATKAAASVSAPAAKATVAKASAAPAKRAPTQEEIGARAHQLWIDDGRPTGRSLDHWFRAERELNG